MAHTLSASASISHETNFLFCNSFHLKPHKNLIFSLKPQTFPISSKLQSLNTISQDSKTPDGKIKSLSKPYIWVNPNSTRAKKLSQKSYDFRYESLQNIAESLNTCNPVESDVSCILDVLFDKRDSKVFQQDAVIVLNNMSNSETVLLVLDYFQRRLGIEREIIPYNVTLKVFRKCKDIERAESLFREMIERGVEPDNVTFSTIISCARHCSLPEKAVEWFEKMRSFGCEPDTVTCSVMIDSYGKIGKGDIALSLYDRARSEKWRIDAVTFATLIKVYGVAGNFDGCLSVYEEMKALKVRPNAGVYNSLLDAMGRAKRPWQAKSIYREMVKNGIEPTFGTYASLIRAYGRARYGEDAVAVYREMKGKGLELTPVLYNTLLSVCADVGFTNEALEIFKDMKSSGTCTPDNFSFAALITMYSCTGKVDEAEATLNEMLKAGFEPNLFVSTSLIQCYGKAGRIDDVVRTFDRLLELGIAPDERFCGCLLSVITQVTEEELNKLTCCIEKANPKLGFVVKLIVGEEIEGEIFKQKVGELFNSIGADVKKAYCNSLIDLCFNLNKLEIAYVFLDLGLTLEIYTDIMSRSETQWSLQLKSLSHGAALTALHVWINDLSRALENGEEFPAVLGINTGHGKHKLSEKGLAEVFESHLKELNAPFHEAPDKVGWFLTTKVAATSWLESRRANEIVTV